jgi:hypothetical protein
VYYRFIEEYRKRTDKKPHYVIQLQALLFEASGFFIQFIQALSKTFGLSIEILPMVNSLDSAILPVTVSKETLESVSLVVHRCLVYLGDIHRYLGTSISKTPDFSVATRYYKAAIAFKCNYGSPYNQLAIISLHKQDIFEALYFYCRSLIIPYPFERAAENINRILKTDTTNKFMNLFFRVLTNGDGMDSFLKEISTFLVSVTECDTIILRILVIYASIRGNDGFFKLIATILEAGLKSPKFITHKKYTFPVYFALALINFKGYKCPKDAWTILEKYYKKLQGVYENVRSSLQCNCLPEDHELHGFLLLQEHHDTLVFNSQSETYKEDELRFQNMAVLMNYIKYVQSEEESDEEEIILFKGKNEREAGQEWPKMASANIDPHQAFGFDYLSHRRKSSPLVTSISSSNSLSGSTLNLAESIESLISIPFGLPKSLK